MTSTGTLHERIVAQVAEATHELTAEGMENIVVPRERWLDAARAIHEAGYVRFIDVTCVDDPPAALRFEVHLVVYSMTEHRWVRLKTRTADKVASVTSLWPAANMYEREAYDLFGVVFEGHPKLTRIMMPDDWQGHPLRRDEALRIEPVDFTVTRELYKT